MKSHSPDYILLGAIIILVVFGLVMLWSASMVKSNDTGRPYYYLQHQLLYGLLAGIPLALFAYKADYRVWKKLSLPIFLIAFTMLVVVLLPGFGFRAGGSTRWISLGGYSFQPSEVAKLALIIYLAAWLDDKSKVNDFRNVFLPFLIIVSLIVGPVILQPNIGTAGVIGLAAIAIFFAAGAQFWQVGSILLMGGSEIGRAHV